MASIAANSYPLEFNFINNPIVLNIQDMQYPEGATFKQVKVSVVVATNQGSGKTKEYIFGVEVGTSNTVGIDISSALRAEMNKWYPTPDLLQLDDIGEYEIFYYPYATFEVEVWEEYMLDGEVYNGNKTKVEKAYAYYGGLSAYERMTIRNVPADYIINKELTKKPRSGALWGNGDVNIQNVLVGYGTEIVGNCVTITDGVLKPGSYYHFMFVNSLGVLETCSAVTRESLSYTIESSEMSLVTTPKYYAESNITVTKSGNRATLKMSSGYVNRAWADWWTTEFLMAKCYWVRYGNTKKQILNNDGEKVWVETPLWLPCTIIPSDEEVSIYNKTEQNLPHIDFEVRVGVEGSILNRFVFNN